MLINKSIEEWTAIEGPIRNYSTAFNANNAYWVKIGGVDDRNCHAESFQSIPSEMR